MGAFTTGLLAELNLRVVLGIVAGIAAAVLWSKATRATTPAPSESERRFAFVRHWGGLGSGEGGWEVEAHAVHYLLSVLGAVLLLGLSAALIITGLPAEASKRGTLSADAVGEGSADAAPPARDNTTPGTHSQKRPGASANAGGAEDAGTTSPATK